MANLWNEVRTIINNYGKSKDILLSLIDKEGNLYSINTEMRRVLDLSNADKKKINLFDYVQKEHVDGLKKSIRISEETRNFYPARLNARNGHYHPLRLQVHPLPFSDSQKQLFLCIGNEVIGQPVLPERGKIIPYEVIPEPETKADPLLTGNENLFQSAMKQAPALTWMIDEDEKLVFANMAFKKYFDLPEAAIQNDIRTYIPKKVIDSLYEKHADALTAGNPVASIEKIYLADGSDISFYVNLFAVGAGNDKKIITGQAYILPVKNAIEKQLEETNEQLLLLGQPTTDAIWEWDMRTGNVFRNEMLMKMTGFQSNDGSGLAWWFRRIHPQDRDRVSDKIKEVTDNGLLSWQDEYRFKCADNDYKEVYGQGYIIYENGLPVKMIGSLRDVSEVKKLQNQVHTEKMDRQKELSETIINGQEKERSRIGYELHDNINQILSTAKLFVDMLTATTPEQKKLKEKGLEYLLLAIEEVRKLSKGLVVPPVKRRRARS
ncbi:MAG: PAS domain-containing protein [Bacteroidota bacterium]